MPALKPRRCGRKGCRKWFVPRDYRQRYCDYDCKNAAAQERLRERAKLYGKPIQVR
jgi:hypothetical protein